MEQLTNLNAIIGNLTLTVLSLISNLFGFFWYAISVPYKIPYITIIVSVIIVAILEWSKARLIHKKPMNEFHDGSLKSNNFHWIDNITGIVAWYIIFMIVVKLTNKIPL